MTGGESERKTGSERKLSSVGDTGFEPVTSSVSAKIRPLMAAALSVLSVRLSTCLIGPGQTYW
jgi:hypothetical protein